MTLPVFPNFPCKEEIIYPMSSVVVQFGGGYTFAAPPNGPDQRTIRLYFQGMRYYLAPDGFSADPAAIGPNGLLDNLMLLKAFYEPLRCYGSFSYTSPILGPIVAQFAKPLALPKGLEGAAGFGVCDAFQLELREVIT